MFEVNLSIIEKKKEKVLASVCAAWHYNGRRSAEDKHNNGHTGCGSAEINHLRKLSVIF